MAEELIAINKIHEPPIGRIPIEVLNKIFSFIEPCERQRIRGICRKWRNAFDVFEDVIRLALTNTNWNFLKNCQNPSLDVAMRSFTTTLEANDPVTKDFVSRIRILTFSGVVIPYNIACVFKECLNLESIGFESCEMSESDSEKFLDEFIETNNVFPPNLQTFKYASPKDREEDGILLVYLRGILQDSKLRNFDFQVFTEEAMDLLTGIYVIGQCSMNLKVSRSCGGFLRDHMKTLRSLTLLGFDDNDIFWDWSGDALRLTFSSLIMTWPPLVTGMEVSNCFDFPVSFPVSSFPTEMMHIMMAPILSSLKKLKMKLHNQTEIWILACGCIQAFGQQLQEISFACDEPGVLNIQCDGQAFSECIFLRKLEILGAAGNSPFINVDRLPSSLKILKTSAVLTYTADDFKMISFDNLKRLQELEISSTSFFELQKSGVVEMTQDSTEHLLKSLTALRKLKVKNSWLEDKDVSNYIETNSDLRVRVDGTGVAIITVLTSFQTNKCSASVDSLHLL